ncbi:MAG: flavodoxin family protein [Desulfobacterales bacterium]
MKILVTYFSQTGNTQKIAEAICEGASPSHEVDLKRIEDIEPANFTGYDLMFIGSPLHAGNLADPVKAFLTQMKAGAADKLAGFITHAAPAYPDQDMEGFTEPLLTACRKNNMAYAGCFNCQGFLAEALHEMIKNSRNMTDEQWSEMVEQMTGHPDEKDLKDAKAFAAKVVA